jgi:hypothetical protein
MPDIGLIGLELRGMMAARHLYRLAPLGILAPLLSLWPYIGSPIVPAALATMITLEPFYNNATNLWKGQMTAGVVLPAGHLHMLRRRNVALIILTWCCSAFFAVVVAYVQPEPPTVSVLLMYALYTATIQFPLLMIGNSVSWQQVRARSRWSLEDAAAAVIMVAGGAIVSIPFLLIEGIPGDITIFLCYSAAMAIIWWQWSLPHTARVLHERMPELWQRIHLT